VRQGVVPPRWFASALASLDVSIDVELAWPFCASAMGLLGLFAAWAAPVPTALALLIGVLGPPVVTQLRRPRRASDEDLVPVLDALVSSMRAGSSVHSAIEGAAGRADGRSVGLGSVAAALTSGAPLDASLRAWSDASGGTGRQLVADAIAISGSAGGSPAEAVAEVTRTLRERSAIAREVRAAASQARASAAVLIVMPVAFLALAAVSDRRVFRFVLGSPGGWLCLALGLSLDAVGAAWMAALVRRVG
jgi:tight adherence protein B